MLRIAQTLTHQLQEAIERAYPEAADRAAAAGQPLDPQLAPASKPEFGDFQANGALALAKGLGQPPRQIAAAIVLRDSVGQLEEDVLRCGGYTTPCFGGERSAGSAACSGVFGLFLLLCL
jgi:arginyl-tRNA synthetase